MRVLEQSATSTSNALLAALSNIGYVLSQKGDLEGAVVEHRRALGIRDAVLGKRHPDSLSSRRSINAAMLREKEI